MRPNPNAQPWIPKQQIPGQEAQQTAQPPSWVVSAAQTPSNAANLNLNIYNYNPSVGPTNVSPDTMFPGVIFQTPSYHPQPQGQQPLFDPRMMAAMIPHLVPSLLATHTIFNKTHTIFNNKQ